MVDTWVPGICGFTPDSYVLRALTRFTEPISERMGGERASTRSSRIRVRALILERAGAAETDHHHQILAQAAAGQVTYA
jgi:hypothetical protein